jgi:hypothetical protein
LLPIKYITVYFSRPLFETFFDKKYGRYTFPLGMYAKMWKHANNIQKAIDRGIQPKEKTNIDAEANISAYCRFARYIIRHHNLNGRQMKDPNTVGTLNVDILSMLEEVYPSAIRLSHGKRIIHEPVWQYFLERFFPMIFIAGFDIYPVWDGRVYEKNGRKILPLKLYTRLERALQAISVTQVFTTGDPFFHQKSDLVPVNFTRKTDSPIYSLSGNTRRGTLNATPALKNKGLPREEALRDGP